MNEVSRADLVTRVATVLLDLEMVMGASAAPIESSPRSAAGRGGPRPAGGTLLSNTEHQRNYIRDLEDWCADAEAEVKKARKRQAPPQTPDQQIFWLIDQYEGQEYRDVAHATGLPPEQVRAMRRRAGRDADYGKPKAA